jgi:GPI-anchor transamidase subunit K
MAKLTKEMSFLKRFKEGLFFTDSCGAITLYEKIDAPNITVLGSSSYGEKSYSNGRDPLLLLPKTDRFSYRIY